MLDDLYELQNLGHADKALPRRVHYEGGANNQRLTHCWIYALGLLGGYRKARPDIGGIVMLYDHKGHMFVITRDGHIRGRVLDALQDAWAYPGCEQREHVTVVKADDPDAREWQAVWHRRGFGF